MSKEKDQEREHLRRLEEKIELLEQSFQQVCGTLAELAAGLAQHSFHEGLREDLKRAHAFFANVGREGTR